MKNSATNRFVIAALACCVSGAAFSDSDDGTCSNATLRGLYVFSASGYQIVAGEAQPKAIIEPLRFNGDGTLTSPGATRSVNGTIFRSPAGGGGTYSLGPDCIGALVFPNGPTFDIFASPKGDDMWMIMTNGTNVFQGNVTRVSTAAPNCVAGSSEIGLVTGAGCPK
jgi:hypothetical protein